MYTWTIICGVDSNINSPEEAMLAWHSTKKLSFPDSESLTILSNMMRNGDKQYNIGNVKNFEMNLVLEIPPINECDISWITDINELEGVFCWIITSVGSETTGTSDDSAEHIDQRVDWSDAGKITQVYSGISF